MERRLAAILVAEMFGYSQECPPALPGAPHKELGGQDARRPLAGRQGTGHGRLSGPQPGDCQRAGRRPDPGLRKRTSLGRPMRRDDFEACIAHLRLPVNHPRTTNLLERLFVEERRRLKIIPNAFGEKAVLKLMFGAMIRAAARWRPIKVTPFEHLQMEALREDLDQEYKAQTGLAKQSSKKATANNLSSSSRT